MSNILAREKIYMYMLYQGRQRIKRRNETVVFAKTGWSAQTSDMDKLERLGKVCLTVAVVRKANGCTF